MNAPQTMNTAPVGDEWILGHLPDRAKDGFVGWIAISRCDGGWMDDDGNACTPTLWAPLPDPQPAPTGWRPPEGVIHVEEITGEGWKINGKPAAVPYRWSVYILRLDGSYDEYREAWHYADYAQAEARAAKWQSELRLSIEVKFLDPKVVPFLRGPVQ